MSEAADNNIANRKSILCDARQETCNEDAVADVGRVPRADEIEVGNRELSGIRNGDACLGTGVYGRSPAAVGTDCDRAETLAVECQIAVEGGAALKQNFVARPEFDAIHLI